MPYSSTSGDIPVFMYTAKKEHLKEKEVVNIKIGLESSLFLIKILQFSQSGNSMRQLEWGSHSQ